MKNKGIWIGAGITLLVIVAICAGSVCFAGRMGGFNMNFGFVGSARLMNTIELSKEEAQKLMIDYHSENLNIYRAQGDTVRIEEYLRPGKEDAKATVTKVNGLTKVEGSGKVSIVIFGFMSGQGEHIDIYLPDEEYQELSFYTSSGNIRMRDKFGLNSSKLSVQASSGNVYWYNTNTQEAAFECSSGNIKCENITAKRASFECSSGNIECDAIKADDAKFKAMSGTVSVGDFTGAGSADASSGDVRIEAERLTGNMDVSARSGNVHLEAEFAEGDVNSESSSGNSTVAVKHLGGKLNMKTASGTLRATVPLDLEFQFYASTNSGDINTDFDNQLSYDKRGKKAEGKIGNNPSQTVTLKSSSGNIRIGY